jgi:hypothetical protein
MRIAGGLEFNDIFMGADGYWWAECGYVNLLVGCLTFGAMRGRAGVWVFFEGE